MGILDKILGGITERPESTVGFQPIPQTPEAEEARRRLFGLATGEPPEIPRREIAPLQPITEERTLARDTAKDLIQSQDFFSLPEVQGIIQEATDIGNLLVNRLGRGLQAAGSLTSTPGRDVLGRAVTSVQKSLAASLAPFAQEERARRERLIPTLETLGLTEEDRARLIEQAGFDADFAKELAKSKQLETFTIPLLQSIIGLQPGVIPLIQGGGPSVLEQLSQAVSAAAPIASAAIKASDERLKTNIKTIDNALEIIEQLDGKTFKFIDGEKSGGVIAQDVEKIMPDIVGEKNGFKTVDYTAIIGVLVNAVKALARKVA